MFWVLHISSALGGNNFFEQFLWIFKVECLDLFLLVIFYGGRDPMGMKIPIIFHHDWEIIFGSFFSKHRRVANPSQVGDRWCFLCGWLVMGESRGVMSSKNFVVIVGVECTYVFCPGSPSGPLKR